MRRIGFAAFVCAIMFCAGTAGATLDGVWKDVPFEQSGDKYPMYVQTYTTGSIIVVVLDNSGTRGLPRFYVFLDGDHSDGVDAGEIGGANAHLEMTGITAESSGNVVFNAEGVSEAFQAYKWYESPDQPSTSDNAIFKDQPSPSNTPLSVYLQTYYELGSAIAIVTDDGGITYYAFLDPDWSDGLDVDDLLGQGAHLTISMSEQAASEASYGPLNGDEPAGTFAFNAPGEEGQAGSLYNWFQAPDAFFLESSAFQDGGAIPDTYTYYGEQITPPLNWGNLPPGTQSLVLFMVDNDAENYLHWLVYDIPITVSGFAEGAGTTYLFTPYFTPLELPGSSKEGINEEGNPGYAVINPPPSQSHSYALVLSAVKKLSLGLPAGATYMSVVDKLFEGTNFLGKADLYGTYKRSTR